MQITANVMSTMTVVDSVQVSVYSCGVCMWGGGGSDPGNHRIE